MSKYSIFYPICLFVMALLFSSCANWYTAVSSKVTNYPQKPVDNLTILFTEYPGEIPNWSNESYNTAIKDKFNNLEFERFRNHLAEVSWDIFFPLATSDPRRIFEDHKEYSFDDLQKKLNESEVEFILLINMKINEPIRTSTRRIFQVYLIEMDTGEQVWSGYGYHNPGNIIRKNTAKRLLKGIKRDLIAEGLIGPKE